MDMPELRKHISCRKQREEVRNFQNILLNTEKMFQEYLGERIGVSMKIVI